MTVLDLPPTTESVPTARRFVRQMMADGDTAADVDTASLLVTEIVTNAVLHARPPMTVRIRVEADVVRIEVGDGSAARPRLQNFSATAATGRGLRLVESLAARWGVRSEPRGGKVVWFEVGPESEAAFAASWALTAEDLLAEGEL